MTKSQEKGAQAFAELRIKRHGVGQLPAGPGTLAANCNLSPWRLARPFRVNCAAHSRSRKVTRNSQHPTALSLTIFSSLAPDHRDTTLPPIQPALSSQNADPMVIRFAKYASHPLSWLGPNAHGAWSLDLNERIKLTWCFSPRNRSRLLLRRYAAPPLLLLSRPIEPPPRNLPTTPLSRYRPPTKNLD